MATRMSSSRCKAPHGSHNDDVTASSDEPLPDDIETLKAMLLAERQAHRAELRDQALLIEKLKQRIARLQQERFGKSSEGWCAVRPA